CSWRDTRSGISAAMPANGGLLARSRLPSPVQRSERQASSALTYSGYPGWPLSTHPPPVYPPPAPASPAGHTTAHSPWPPGSYSPPSVCTPHHPPPAPHRPTGWHLPGRTHTTHPAGADTPATAPPLPPTPHTPASYLPATAPVPPAYRPPCGYSSAGAASWYRYGGAPQHRNGCRYTPPHPRHNNPTPATPTPHSRHLSD